MDTTSFDPTTATNSLLQSLAFPLLLGTVASIILLVAWVVIKIISAAQMRHAYADLREIRRLLSEMNHRDELRTQRDQAQVTTPNTPVAPAESAPQI